MSRGSFFCAWLVGAAGCATLRMPSEGGRPWHEIQTEHVTLYTDLGEDEAMRAARGFESRHHMLAAALFAGAPPPLRTRVVAFRHERDFDELAPSSAAAFYTPLLPLDVQPTPTIVMHGSPTDATYSTWLHELTHRFIAVSMGPVPAWLNEGLAEYYSTIRADDGVLYVGSHLGDVALVGGGGWRVDVERGTRRVAIPITQLPPASRLMALEPAEFYLSRGKQVDHDLNHARTANYGGAWALVHMLVSDPQHRPRYERMAGLFADGMSADDALCGAFGDASAAELDASLVAYVQRPTLTVWPQGYEPPPEVEPTLTPMLEARVLVLWSKLGLRRPERDRTTLVHLTRAFERAPTDPWVLLAMGAFSLAQGDHEQARTRLEAARALAPTAPDPLVALMSLYDDEGAPWPAEERAQWLREIAAQLELAAGTATELSVLARYYVRRGELDEALARSTRALQADPNCGECFGVHAQVLFAQGQPRRAARMQRVAIDKLYEHASDAALDALEHQLREYEAAARTSEGSQGDDDVGAAKCWVTG